MTQKIVCQTLPNIQKAESHMYEAFLGIAALAMVYLGYRLVRRFREMSSWSDNDPIVDGSAKAALPSELRELKIEEPSEDIVADTDNQKGENTSGDSPPPKNTT